MALNQSAINVKVINGAETVQFSQALNVTSTAIASFLRGLSTIKSIVSSVSTTLGISFTYTKNLIADLATSSSSIVKGPYGKLLTATSSVLASFERLMSLFRTLTATSLSDTTFLRYVGKLVLEVEVVTATIITATNRLLTLLAYSSSSATFKRDISLAITTVISTVTATITTTRTLVQSIIASVSSIVTVSSVRIYYRTLSVLSSSAASIIKNAIKTLTISVNCGIILYKYVNKYITYLSSPLITLIASAISFINYPANKFMYAASKIRNIFYK